MPPGILADRSSMNGKSKNAYLRTRVLTASPAELRLMLFDGAIRFAEQAREALREKDFEQVHDGICRAQDIVMELINSLRPEHDPQLCDKLSALYVFIYTRLMNASSRRDLTPLDEALELLRYERDTWAMVLEKLAKENLRAGEAGPAALDGVKASRREADSASAAAPAEKLVGGRVSVQG
jgi:flagellar secretion chaperone FliS